MVQSMLMTEVKQAWGSGRRRGKPVKRGDEVCGLGRGIWEGKESS